MYSYDDRIRAVRLYIQYDKSAAAVIRELGYPERKTLRYWYKEYLRDNGLKKKFVRSPKYNGAQKEAAVKHYMEHGKCASRTIRALGYPSRALLKQWVMELCPEEKPHCSAGRSLVHLTKEQKEAAVMELCTKDENAQEIASRYHVSRCSIYQLARELLGEGSVSSVPKRNKAEEPKPATIEELRSQVNDLTKQARELKDEVFRLRVERDVLEKAAEEEGVSLGSLTNRDKAVVIDALRNRYRLKTLLSVLQMSKSSYFYQEAAMAAPDNYRWPGWISRMKDAGLIRSMSKKGCSPDNSACEGFFGRLKNEMFYGRSWQDVSIDEFIKILDDYMHWYAEERIKISLGGISPIQYRRQLGLTA